jgi:UDP-N-acetylglucosamine diphosphorylase/glucosamine-1-phosphate N-acetyltransferase
MAGGLGKRMESTVPKVLHKLDGVPLIVHILSKLQLLGEKVKMEKIFIVVGKYKEQIQNTVDAYVTMQNISYIYQEEALGTGHAILCCRNELLKYPNSDVLILSGDVPMLTNFTMLQLLNKASNIKIITTNMADPLGYGRILTENQKFVKIVEQKDCTEAELCIKNVNTGIYCINSKLLCNYLPHLKNNNSQKEYYLTDIIEIIKNEENIDIDMLEIEKEKVIEVTGINTADQLKELENLIKKLRINI